MGANASVSENRSFILPLSPQQLGTEMENISSICPYESVDFDRFMLIVGVGTPFAIIGIIFNFIACVIYARPHHLRTSNLYFAVLALLDIAFCILYILLMTVDAISLHYGYISLYAFYITYYFQLFALAKIIQLSSVYMVVAATIERFFLVRKWSDAAVAKWLSPRARVTVVLAISLVGVSLRSPSFWEYGVVLTNCSDPFGVYQFEERLSADDSYEIFNFYVMNVVLVFIPFVLLTILNVGIIRTLRRRLSLAKKFLFPLRYVSEVTFEKGVSREKLKAATYTLVALVTGYLISNFFNMVITVLEYTAKNELLQDEQGQSYRWYTLSSDISSVLTIGNSCARLPSYCLCSRALRYEFYALFSSRYKRRERETKRRVRGNEDCPLNNSTQFCEAS